MRTIKSRIAPIAAAIAIGGALLLSGCTDSGAQKGSSSVSIPNTAYGDEVKWVVDQVNGKGELEVKQWEAKLSSKLTKATPASDIVGSISKTVKPGGPYEIKSYEAKDGRATARITGKKASYDLVIALDGDTKDISGIFFRSVQG